MYLSNVFLTE